MGASRVDIYIYIYIPRPRCHPTVDDPPSPVSPRSPPDSSLWSRSILSGLCSPRPRVPFRSLPIQPLAVGRRWYASEDKEEQRRIIVELRRIQGTVSSFTSCVVCSCCSTSSVVFVVTRGPESTTTSPSSSTTCRFTLVSICLVVVISFFFRVSHSSGKRKRELKRERERKSWERKKKAFVIGFSRWWSKDKRDIYTEVDTRVNVCQTSRATRLRSYLVSSYLNHGLGRPHHGQTMHDNHVRGITFFDQSHGILRVDLEKQTSCTINLVSLSVRVGEKEKDIYIYIVKVTVCI